MSLSLNKTLGECLPHARNQIEGVLPATGGMHICLYLDCKETRHCIDLQIKQVHWGEHQKEPRKNKKIPESSPLGGRRTSRLKNYLGDCIDVHSGKSSTSPTSYKHTRIANGVRISGSRRPGRELGSLR